MHPTHKPTTTAPAEPTPADIPRGAARYPARHGWQQGAYHPHRHGAWLGAR